MTETGLLQRLLLHASRRGLTLFRNNVGVLRDHRGIPVRYGLCVGSSDLVGWTPVIVTPEMVGRTLAVFTAVEAKVGRRQATAEQARFLDVVQAAGGIATLARETDDVDAAIACFSPLP